MWKMVMSEHEITRSALFNIKFNMKLLFVLFDVMFVMLDLMLAIDAVRTQ